jgi:hypothetical protein
MLHTLSTLSQDQFMVLIWIAICASVVLVTVAVLVAQRIQLALTRRAVLKARVAAVMGGRI